MLEESNFKKLFKQITEYYRHEVSGPIGQIFYEYISENLTETEFVQAMELAVLHHPVRMQLPSPVEFVELIRGSKQAKAFEEWQIVRAAAGSNDIDALDRLSARGHVALNAIGGLSAVGYQEGSLQV